MDNEGWVLMNIYIDTEYCCHTTNPDGAFREIETDFFEGKCTPFIEGHLFIPSGKSWTRSDGFVFHGEMIAPCKPYGELSAAQAQYEADLAEAAAAYQEGVNAAYDQ